MKIIYQTCDHLRFFHRHHGANRQAEFLLMDLLGDGQREVVPFAVTFLFVGRNRIVDEGLDTVFRQILLQFVAFFAENRENVIDVVGVWQATGQRNQRIVDVVVIVVGNHLPMGVVVV